MPHNHPPRCCCSVVSASGDTAICGSCPHHGDLAQLARECPECHQLAGRQHTDYCTGTGTVL